MPYGMYISAEGANAQSRRLEVLSNNLANVDTPGFKRDQAVFQARLSEATQRGLDLPGTGTINDIGGGVDVLATVTDYSQAAPRKTGTDTDLTINGDSFFVVQRGDQKLLTRAGNFFFDANGNMVNPAGDRVLDATMVPIVVDGTLPVTMSPDGGIVQDGDVFQIAMVRPRSLGDLAKVGENLFLPLAPFAPVEPGDRRTISGHLEQSNVKPAVEMMEMIETTRAFEANTTLIRNQDQMLGNLISQVLKEN